MNIPFKMHEVINSDTANREKINNMPDIKSLDNLFDLLCYCLIPIREYIGKPMIITSGYRCPRLNQLVGGKPTSQHQRGQAADFVINGLTPATIINKIIASGIEYDQIINEHDQWVHISYVHGHNRKQPPFKI